MFGKIKKISNRVFKKVKMDERDDKKIVSNMKKLSRIYDKNTNVVLKFISSMEEDERSKETIRLYKTMLMQFSSFCSKHDKDITSDITKKDIIEYIKMKKESGKWKASSENVFKTCIRNLYKWMSDELATPLNYKDMQKVFHLKKIYSKICSLKLSKYDNEPKTDKAMEYKDVVKLLRIAKERDDYEYNCMYLLFYFGFRKSELLNLKVKYINLEDNSLYIPASVSKTNVYRKLYYNNYVKLILMELIGDKPPEYYLIGDRIPRTHHYLNNMFIRYEDVMGMRLYPHRTRHTCNNEFRKSIPSVIGDQNIIVDLAVKKIIGHRIKDITDRYSSISDDIIREIMINHHWLKLKI